MVVGAFKSAVFFARPYFFTFWASVSFLLKMAQRAFYKGEAIAVFPCHPPKRRILTRGAQNSRNPEKIEIHIGNSLRAILGFLVIK